uniref:NADH-ubiquinone oxidoreductase chain 3 n=1 Tax=Typosyllis antoni TaxID=1898412 RepID=A0A1C9UZG3_9ANNE|nr:NADH dehydrogenase subunit 3 [Typosyllis antoni]AOR87153.1 NADH dehydrogenase subunit 3 [Typosyllis antoni]
MMTLLPLFAIAFFIPLILALTFYLINFSLWESSKNRETSSPFECGFSSSSKARTPFSLRFFLLAVLFLIFDIEIVIILPAPILMNTISMSSFIISLSVFLLILTAGLIHEWNEGSLEWLN